jgi:penicillin-binding protein 2
MKPFIVSKITDEKNAIVYNTESKILKSLDMSLENFEIVKEGMRGVVTLGSAKMLNNLTDMKVAGKTGSPQIESGRKTNAFFVAFAPYENPEVLILVLLEEPPEGSVAAIPVVDQLMR